MRCDYEPKLQDYGLLEIMTCYSHDNSFVVLRIASGSAIWLRLCVCVLGGHSECRSVREFWNCVGAGKAEKSGSGARPA